MSWLIRIDPMPRERFKHWLNEQEITEQIRADSPRAQEIQLAQLGRHRVARLAALAGHGGDEDVVTTRVVVWTAQGRRWRGFVHPGGSNGAAIRACVSQDLAAVLWWLMATLSQRHRSAGKTSEPNAAITVDVPWYFLLVHN